MAAVSSRSLPLGAHRRCTGAASSTTVAFGSVCSISTTSRSRLTPATRPVTVAAHPVLVIPALRGRRCFSGTQQRGDNDEGVSNKKRQSAKDVDGDEDGDDGSSFSVRDMLQEAGVLESYSPKRIGALEREMDDMLRSFDQAERPTPKAPDQFWNEEEEDPEMVIKDGPDEDDPGYDMSSMAHGRLDEIREQRHLARIIVWEMPLLSKFAKKFEPPGAEQPLRFRYTSYMGELHPAERKVVVEFCPADFDLTPTQADKLRKLVGPRYNPEKDIVHMSCEKFEHQAQNKRYLGDLVDKLLIEARDPTDTFEDVPLDTRHHKFKYKPKFPREWRLTDARKEELKALRAASFELDQKMLASGSLVDGEQSVSALGAPAAADKVPEMVRLPKSPRALTGETRSI
ncbi:37S ribosomal protein S24, mitochondrial [Sporothrix epigloea]|uniref:37S ribosomal protein S24, mitochondrial n=1 Tax=Sporothrix epigloea TaxID=1892477 RepID=A0ABP0D431_9PEZI